MRRMSDYPTLKWIAIAALAAAISSPAENSSTAAGVAVTNHAESFSETPGQRDARMGWWREARFGMFIHWGLYAIPGRGEWVQWNEQIPVGEYARLADQFNPTNFNPNAWAETAKAAGMKYMVLT